MRMPPYRIAQLSHSQLMALEQLENDLGVTLVAYAPEAAEREHAEGAAAAEAENDLVLDALVDTYRTYDPTQG